VAEDRTMLTTPPVGTTRQVTVADRSLHVWAAGDAGPTILLIHGIPTNHTVWWDVVPRLAPRARVLAVDMLGYGRSARPGGKRVDIAAQASYVVELLDALGIDRATVVGHDIGGGVAQILAVRHGERVERLALIDAVCYDGWPVPAAKVLKLASPVLEHLPARPTVEALKAGLRTLFAHRERAGRFVDAFVEPFASVEGMDVFVEHLRALDSKYTEELAPALPRLRLPVAVIWGGQDHQMKPKYAARLAGDIPTAQVTWVDDASHFVPADRPDVVADAITRLVSRPADARHDA